MILWICNANAKVGVSSDTLRSKFDIQCLDVVLCITRMRKFRQVKRSTDWFAELCKLNVVAEKRPDRPKRTWDEELMDDRKGLGMDSEWRVRLRGSLVFTLV